MPSATSVLADKVEGALREGEVQKALDEIAKFPDLRHNELPKIDNKIWKSLSQSERAVRALALAAASPHESVRRFCKKYLPKMGAAAAETLALLTLETVYPTRPVPKHGEGSLGSFGGYASPVGQNIAEQKLSFTVKSPAVYSPAGKYAKEVMALLIELLGSMPPAQWLPLVEFNAAHFRALLDQEKPPAPPPWQVEDAFNAIPGHNQSDYLFSELGQLENRIHEIAKTPEATLVETLVAWAGGRIVSLQAPANTVAKRVGERLSAMTEEDRFCAGRKLRRVSAASLVSLGEQRPLLYRELQRGMSDIDEREKKVVDSFFLKRFRESKPAEWAAMEAAALGKAAPESAAPSDGPAHVAAYLPAGEGGAVAGLIEAQVARLAKLLGQRQLWLDIWYSDKSNVKYRGQPEEKDIPIHRDYPQAAADLDLLKRLLAWDKEYENKEEDGRLAFRTFPHRFETTLVPNSVLDGADWGEALMEMLGRALALPLGSFKERYAAGTLTPHQHDLPSNRTKLLSSDVSAVIQFGFMMLPGQLLNAWEDHVMRALDGLAVHVHGGWEHGYGMPEMITLLETRRILPIRYLERILVDWDPVPIEAYWWQEMFTLLYAGGHRDLALRLLRAVRLPDEPENPGYKRHFNWYPCWQWTLNQALQQEDFELWRLAFEKFVVPYALDGKTPVFPKVEAVDFRHQSSPGRWSRDNIALKQIWTTVLQRNCPDLPAMADTALRQAQHYETCRTTLELMCGTLDTSHSPFRGRLPLVLDLIESAQGPVQLCGLEVLEVDPRTAESDVTGALRAIDRCLASTVSGVLQASASTLVAVAQAFPDARPEAMRMLLTLLSHETAAVLEHTLKSVAKLLGKKAPAGLQLQGLRERVKELEEKDPRRFGKLAQKVLGAL